MSWVPLSQRLSTLPLVLAGPMLRQVTPNAVTVWFALLRPATVSLRVFATGSPGTDLMSSATAPNAPRATTAIGKNLHVVAVTVRSDTSLVPGQIYCYDVTFVDGGQTRSLADAITKQGDSPPDKPFAYVPHDFPSFALPPADLNYLRLIHGSCRKPHGGPLPKDQPAGPDQLSTLDGLIETDANNAMHRPHQLVLTGDQIYADDCEDVLLMALTDAGDTLLGWSSAENIPAVPPDQPYKAADLAATARTDVITRAGFTGDDRRSHVISLAEFFAMYLFVWSEVLWYDPLTFDEFQLALPAAAAGDLDAKFKAGYDDRQAAVASFRKTLPNVRRALANIPSYMILDDHEVTDDFNMTRHFVQNVYSKPFGQRLVQNGLVAYSICQVWGNVPEQFDASTPTAAGTTLLSLLAQVSAATNNAQQYDTLQAQFMTLVGVHDWTAMSDGNDGTFHAFHDGTEADEIVVEGIRVNTKSLRYNFSIEGPAHQVILTDTRTWRGFVGKSQHPSFLYKQLDDQLNRLVPPLNGRLQLVVFTTNAPPIALIRMAAGSLAVPLLHHGPDFDDLYDSWFFPSRVFDEMLVAVSNRLPKHGDTITGSVLFLSGDVHFSFSSRMQYWATVARLGDAANAPQKATVVIGQLVSSSLKNEADATRAVGLGGYAKAPHGSLIKAFPALLGLGAAAIGAGVASWAADRRSALRGAEIGALLGVVLGFVLEDLLLGGSLPPHAPEAYVGWNIAPDGPDKVITTSGAYPLSVTSKDPTLKKNLDPTELTAGSLLSPDYRYRLDYLTTVRTGQTANGTPAPIGTPSSADKKAAGQSFAAAAQARRDLVTSGARLPECIGNNAIGEITFTWPAGDPATTTGKVATHRVHWQSAGTDGKPMWADYDVSMDVDDTNYLDMTKGIAP
jgi:hypothetical protein